MMPLAFRPGRRAVAAALGLALATMASAQQSQPSRPGPPTQLPAGEPQPAQIDRNGVLILIRSTLLALHHANQTGNYTVLRDLGAPGFQAANTAARLAEIFASQRAQNLDLFGVAVLEPQLTVPPQMVQGGRMRMAGFFPSVPEFRAPVRAGRGPLAGVRHRPHVGQAAPAALQAPPEPPKLEAAKPEEKPAETARPAPRPRPRPQPRAPAEP